MEPQFHCSECDFRTWRRSNFQNHLIKMHNVDHSDLANYGAGIISLMTRRSFPCRKCLTLLICVVVHSLLRIHLFLRLQVPSQVQANERAQTPLDDGRLWGKPFFIPVHLMHLPIKAQLESQKAPHHRSRRTYFRSRSPWSCLSFPMRAVSVSRPKQCWSPNAY